MKTTKIKISEIKPNKDNPRIIKDDKFKKLVTSIIEFPEMLEIRPIVVNSDMVVLGGNMRLKACKEAGLKEVPIIKAENLTAEQQKEFIIKDNVSGGEWDFDILANDWDCDILSDWGLDIPNLSMQEELDIKDIEEESKNNPPIIKVTCVSVEQLQKCEIDILELLERKYPKAYLSVSMGEL